MPEIRNIKTESDIPFLLAAGAANAEMTKIPLDADLIQPAFVVPKDYRVEYPDLDKFEKNRAKPKRKQGLFKFADVESFIRYYLEHSDENSRIFADINDDTASYEAVLNFHGADPSWNDHKCRVELQPTHEWLTWCANNKKEMSQTEFASFLEENAEMFITPPGAKLLELVSNLEGKCHADFTQGIKLQSGAINLKYTEVVELSGGVNGPKDGAMTVPAMLEASIAPFEGTTHYTIKARLRFRINNRKLFFFYEAVEPHLVVRTVCADVSKVIEEKTKQRPFRV
jgi:uncharacterized protein YfdQ (DUF2303 family)